MVGGVPTSQHVKGEAADIAAEDPHALGEGCQGHAGDLRGGGPDDPLSDIRAPQPSQGRGRTGTAALQQAVQGKKALIFKEYERFY